MQTDFVPKLSPSGGSQNMVTAMDVFSRYLFAYHTSSQDAKMIAKIIINIMTKHAYLPTIINSDMGSVFISQVINEVAEVLKIPHNMLQQNVRRQLECLNERMPHSRKILRLKRVKKDPCGISMSTLQS